MKANSSLLILYKKVQIVANTTVPSMVYCGDKQTGKDIAATLTIVPSGSEVILTWPGGKLLEATNLTGPWVTNNAAASPYTVSAAGAGKFYRVQLQP
jgi:hypothetical protein